jgi:chemotaxis signal transduction protein
VKSSKVWSGVLHQDLGRMSGQQLTRYMPTVVGYRERLATLQGAWDSLALLSHLNGDGTNLGSTRQAFESLAVDLVTHLAAETQKKALLAAKARAQVAIDILVRNLFERTADIGFLAADEAIRNFARDMPALRKKAASQDEGAARLLSTATRSLQRRLAEYVAKYSVYHNVIVLSLTGEVLVQLEDGNAPSHSTDPLITTTLASDRPYVETFRHSDLVQDCRRALIYSHAIKVDQRNVGVLCLCFRLADECEGIFGRLHSEGDWNVLCLLGADGEVIASSDAYQVPLGAKISAADPHAGQVVRFAGREYLAITRSAQPYQGYAGPPWRGHVMIPLERAFEAHDASAQLNCSPEILADLRASAATFSEELRAIPQQADRVQVDLNRSVWNGSVRLSSREGSDGTFAKALLREISQMGRKTQEVFERSIAELHETVVSSILDDSQFMASLAVELLARNLYERANDCRWWALDATLIGRLAGRDGMKSEDASSVLKHINALYTVYHGIVLFDSDRRVIAVSREEHEGFVGTPVDEPWAAETLSITGTQAYSVSDFRASAFYADQPTLIYGAPVRSTQGRVVGGVAVIFDSKPQLAAMLNDSLPRDERGEPMPGCIAMFLDRDLQVIAATDTTSEVQALAVEAIRERHGKSESRVICAGDTYYAQGAGPDTGYREYPGLGGYAVVLIPLGKVSHHHLEARALLPQRAATRSEGSKQSVMEYATFAVGREWYAVRAANVIEAIDASGVQPLPAQAHWCAGFIMFQGAPIVVADMGRVLDTTCLDTPRVVVVMRTPGRPDPFGILVETLGDISEVSEARLLPIADPRNEHGQLVEHAVQPLDPNDVLVLTLNIERLSVMMGGQAAERNVA